MGRLYLLLVLAASTSVGFAQPRADPSDALLPVAQIDDASAFANYQSFREQKPAPWQAINAAVADKPGARHDAGVVPAAEATPPPQSQHGVHHAAGEKSTSASAKLDTPPRSSASVNADAQDAGQPPTATVTAIGVIREIDRTNARAKITHEPIQELGWPQMTMYFRLKDARLAGAMKPGDKVKFLLEKTASGYVISRFEPASSRGRDR